MLSGCLCWEVLEEQLLHTRTSSDKIRKKIFDLAVEQRESLKREGKIYSQKKLELSSFSPSVSYNSENAVMMSSASTTKEGSHGTCPPDHSPLDNPQTSSSITSGTGAARGGGAGYDCNHSWLSTKRPREKCTLHQEAAATLAAVMDLSTHLHNYSQPVDVSLARFVVAEQDLYIPRQHVANVQDTWPGKAHPLLTHA